MIADLTPYPAMKDSGVPWLGAVPEHWEVRRLRNVAELRVSTIDKHIREDELPVRLCNYVDVYKNDRIRLGMSFMSATARAEDISRFRLEDGDVLITKDSEVWNDIGVPALVDGSADDLVSGYHLALLRPRARTCVGAFLLRALQSLPVAYQFHVEATGVTRYGLSHDAIKSVWLPAPPLPEQQAIVRYLDYMDRRIRRYIRAKQKLIKLLEEEKQAIIHRAVTGQIDVRTGEPYPAYKPSGVEWLGDVPAEWEVEPLKSLVPQVTVGIVVQPARLYVDRGVPCLRSLNISTGAIVREPLVYISAESNAKHLKSQVFEGDLVVVRTGRAGVAALVTQEFDGANCIDLLIVRRSTRLISEYLLTYLNSWVARTDAQYRSVGAIQAHYNTATLGNLRVAAPPTEMQNAILDFLADELGRVDAAMASATRQLDLAREYRTRLIADAVTGKLDVREAAAQLSDEPDEEGPLGDAELLLEEESIGEEDLLEPDDAGADRGEL